MNELMSARANLIKAMKSAARDRKYKHSDCPTLVQSCAQASSGAQVDRKVISIIGALFVLLLAAAMAYKGRYAFAFLIMACCVGLFIRMRIQEIRTLITCVRAMPSSRIAFIAKVVVSFSVVVLFVISLLIWAIKANAVFLSVILFFLAALVLMIIAIAVDYGRWRIIGCSSQDIFTEYFRLLRLRLGGTAVYAALKSMFAQLEKDSRISWDKVLAAIFGRKLQEPYAESNWLTWSIVKQPVVGIVFATGFIFLAWQLLPVICTKVSPSYGPFLGTAWLVFLFMVEYAMCWCSALLLIAMLYWFASGINSKKMLVKWQLAMFRKLASWVMIIPCLLFAWGAYEAYGQIRKVKGEVKHGDTLQTIETVVHFAKNTSEYEKRENRISVQGYYFMCRARIENFDEFMEKMSPVVAAEDEIKQNIDAVKMLFKDAFQHL